MAGKKKDKKSEGSSPSAQVEVVPSTYVVRQEVPEEPVIESFTIKKLQGGWHFIHVKTQGDKVIEKILSEVEPKAICLEKFKINVGRYLIRLENES